MIHAQTAARLRADPGRPPVAKKRAPSQELEDDDSESEGSEEESATETESVATTRTDQVRDPARLKLESGSIQAMFTLGARARLSLGTNVNTPFFQGLTPEFGHGVQGRDLVLRH